MRRLTTLIIVHWFMDTFAIMSIIMAPVPKWRWTDNSAKPRQTINMFKYISNGSKI
jgi:hypothetical protein